MTNAPIILKADGSRETFDPGRLASSLMRAGAGAHTAERIAEQMAETIVPGTSSREIYAKAFALLRKEARPLAARYALRRALLELGPSGHPFEDFVSQLFIAEGWRVETRKMIKGKCVMHEVDFYASHAADNTHVAAELKYHNDAGYKTDLKVALYVKSRFDDIFSCEPKSRGCPIDRGLLVTNTKFTSEAIAYAECAGVELLGWGYPAKDNLCDRMNKAKVYPITALTALTRTEKRQLIDAGIVTVGQILASPFLLSPLRRTPEEVGGIMAEAEGMHALADLARARDTVFS